MRTKIKKAPHAGALLPAPAWVCDNCGTAEIIHNGGLVCPKCEDMEADTHRVIIKITEEKKEVPSVTKVCINPQCEAVYHNTPKTRKTTKCLDCGARLLEINEDTFRKKYAGWFFQYDYKTHEYLRR